MAECFKLTGEDPDGDDNAMLAASAVSAVRQACAERDALSEALAAVTSDHYVDHVIGHIQEQLCTPERS